nr:TonB-dependent receptor plug domain-containing protein [Burkholderiaceae bacterium]
MTLRPSATIAAVMAIAPLPCALAQASLDEVVVTATGRQADAHETPQAIEVLRPGQAGTGESAGAAPPGALFRGEPGLAVQSDGAWGQNPVLRGLKKESVVILVDGVRVNSAQPQGAIASFLDLLDRAEVVKGPASVLYGSGAMGGVVNLITPAPRYSDGPESGARFGSSWGSADSGLAGAMLLRHSNSDYGLVVGLAGRNVDDYESPRGTEENTGYRSHSLLARYKQRLTDGIDLRLNLQRHTDRDVWYPGSARTGGQPGGAGIPPPLGTVTIRSPEQRRELYEVGVDARLGSGELSAELYRQEVSRQIRAWSERLGRDYVRNDVTFVT